MLITTIAAVKQVRIKIEKKRRMKTTEMDCRGAAILRQYIAIGLF